MNWKKGMFRVWIVASSVWAIVWLIWAMSLSANHFDLWLASCDPLGSSEEFAKCSDRASDERDKYFVTLISPSQTWLILFVPPLLALAVGPLLMKIGAWIGAGFSANSK